MNKPLSFSLIGLLSLFLASCYPYVMPPQPQAPAPVQPVETRPASSSSNTYTKPKVSNPNQTVTSKTQKQIREQESIKPRYEPTTPAVSAPKPPVKKSYPTAVPIPGKPGYVYNPYNNNPVNVDGIASGKTVRDPKDPNTEHKFKVP